MNPEGRCLHIEGMSTAADAIRVEKRLNALADATAIVNLSTARAIVYAEPQVTNGLLRDAVAEAGCAVSSIEY